MQEKRLRRQEQEGQAKSPAEADSSQKQSASSALKRKTPATTCQSPAEPPPPSRISVRKLVSLKPRAPSPPKKTASPGLKTVAMAIALSDSPKQSSTDFLDKTKRGTVSQPSALITRESSQPAELPADSNQTKTLEHPGSCKGEMRQNWTFSV